MYPCITTSESAKHVSNTIVFLAFLQLAFAVFRVSNAWSLVTSARTNSNTVSAHVTKLGCFYCFIHVMYHLST